MGGEAAQIGQAAEDPLVIPFMVCGHVLHVLGAVGAVLHREPTRLPVPVASGAVDDVAEALFREWKQELDQYSNTTLRRESERELDLTRRRYEELIQVMKRAADRMEPVLATFRDQVLFL